MGEHLDRLLDEIDVVTRENFEYGTQGGLELLLIDVLEGQIDATVRATRDLLRLLCRSHRSRYRGRYRRSRHDFHRIDADNSSPIAVEQAPTEFDARRLPGCWIKANHSWCKMPIRIKLQEFDINDARPRCAALSQRPHQQIICNCRSCVGTFWSFHRCREPQQCI